MPPFFFIEGDNQGHLYRVEDPEKKTSTFLLSPFSDYVMSHESAARYCYLNCYLRRGGLPFRQQLKALKRALSQDGTYSPEFIAKMKETSFWSSTLHSKDIGKSYFMDGANGQTGYISRRSAKSAVCIRW